MIADIVGIPVADREWLFGLTKELLQGGDTEHVATMTAAPANAHLMSIS